VALAAYRVENVEGPLPPLNPNDPSLYSLWTEVTSRGGFVKVWASDLMMDLHEGKPMPCCSPEHAEGAMKVLKMSNLVT
jgi:hypothetical protein